MEMASSRPGVHYWDKNGELFSNRIRFFRNILKWKPSVLILSNWVNDPAYPAVWQIKLPKKIIGFQIAVFWYDTCSRGFLRDSRRMIQIANANVPLETPQLCYLDQLEPRIKKTFVAVFTPFRPGLWLDLPKTTSVSFIGSIGRYRSYRREYIEAILAANLPLYLSTSDQNRTLSFEEYRRIIGSTQIVVNFSMSVDCHQLKGRVFEALFSGALLWESENTQTSTFFVPYRHYVPFTSSEDLVRKIQYYLLHSEERNAIAQNGKAFAQENFTTNCQWMSIFATLKDGQLQPNTEFLLK